MFSPIDFRGDQLNSNYLNHLDTGAYYNEQNQNMSQPGPTLRGWPVTVCVEGIGFSYQLTNDDLYKVFSRYGNVAHVEIMMPDGNSANVFYSAYDEASRAIASLDGKELAGVKGHLRVSWGQLPTLPTGMHYGSNEVRGGDPMRKFTCRFEIGIENDKDFQVARRIIGQKGVNMKDIVARTDAKLRLRGRGSGYLEGITRQESPEPLHLCVSCTSKRGYAEAARLVSELLEGVYAEYRDYCMSHCMMYPQDLKVTIREHPLGSGPYPPIDVVYHDASSHSLPMQESFKVRNFGTTSSNLPTGASTPVPFLAPAGSTRASSAQSLTENSTTH